MGAGGSLELSAEEWQHELAALTSPFPVIQWSGQVNVATADMAKEYYGVLTESALLFFEDELQFNEAKGAEGGSKPIGVELHETQYTVDLQDDDSFRILDADRNEVAKMSSAELGELVAAACTRDPSLRDAPGADDFCDEDEEDGESGPVPISRHVSYDAYQEVQLEEKEETLHAHELIVSTKKRYCKIRGTAFLMYKTWADFNAHKRPAGTVDLHGAMTDEYSKSDNLFDMSAMTNCCSGGREGSEGSSTENPNTDVPVGAFTIVCASGKRISVKCESMEMAQRWRSDIDKAVSKRLTKAKRKIAFLDFMKQLRTGDVLMMAGKKWMCRKISAVTGYEYDHTALCISAIGSDENKACYIFDSTGDGVCVHNFVKFHTKKWFLPYKKTVWRKLHVLEASKASTPNFEKLDLSNVREDDFPPEMEQRFLEFVKDNTGKRYSIGLSKLRAARASDTKSRSSSTVGEKGDTQGMFCSEAVALAYQRAQLLRKEDGVGASYVPGSFSMKRSLQLVDSEWEGTSYKSQWGEEIEIEWDESYEWAQEKAGKGCLG